MTFPGAQKKKTGKLLPLHFHRGQYQLGLGSLSTSKANDGGEGSERERVVASVWWWLKLGVGISGPGRQLWALGSCRGQRVLCSSQQPGPLTFRWVLFSPPWYCAGPSDIGKAGSVQDRACSRRGGEGWTCNKLSLASGHGSPRLSHPRAEQGTRHARGGQ